MKIKPLNDKVLIKIEEVKEKTVAGLYIPQSAQEKTQIGVVEAVGTSKEISVKVKDRVMYNKYSGTSFKDGNTEYLIVKNEDIIAIVS